MPVFHTEMMLRGTLPVPFFIHEAVVLLHSPGCCVHCSAESAVGAFIWPIVLKPTHLPFKFKAIYTPETLAVSMSERVVAI